jgi:hypothetical protein
MRHLFCCRRKSEICQVPAAGVEFDVEGATFFDLLEESLKFWFGTGSQFVHELSGDDILFLVWVLGLGIRVA